MKLDEERFINCKQTGGNRSSFQIFFCLFASNRNSRRRYWMQSVISTVNRLVEIDLNFRSSLLFPGRSHLLARGCQTRSRERRKESSDERSICECYD